VALDSRANGDGNGLGTHNFPVGHSLAVEFRRYLRISLKTTVKSWLLLVVFVALTGSAQQTASRPTAALFGRVVNAVTQEPVRRASVKIYNTKDQWDELTDGEGRFKFPPLLRAEYKFMVHRDGFTERSYKVELSDFDDPKELPIELFPQGVIAGKVVDGFGQPLQRAEIQALRADQAGGSEWTNDLGEYRLSGLDPGSYRIRVTYREGRESELDPTPITTASATKAIELTVKPGALISGIDFVLNPVRPVSVRGTIHTETGQPVDRASFSLAGPNGESSGPGNIDAGKFEIPDVSPGSYTILAKTFDKTAPLFGSVTVEVRGEDVSGVDLTMHPSPKIEGRIQVESGNIENLDSIHILFRPADHMHWSTELALPDRAGAFTVGLNPGEYTLTMPPLPDDFVVETVTLDEAPLTNWKIKIDSSVDPKKLVIVLAPKKQP
jgi:Carboxypeptidase regulatory-like domain